MATEESKLTEHEKVRRLYELIGNRGLYVNTNFDVFPQAPEQIALAGGAGFNIPLINPGQRAYASPLLFASLTSLINRGTMLVTGAPGIGKTTGAEFAGHFFTGTPLEDILSASIKGNPQLTEEKMIARYKLGKLMTTGEEEASPRKFLTCPVKILDEGNRIPPDTCSLLMDVVDRGKAVYGDTLLEATPGPLFMTANYADEGTFQLTPPFLDRFDVAVMVTSPQPWDLRRIRARGDDKLNGGIESKLKIPGDLKLDFEAIRKQIHGMPEETEHDMSKVAEFGDFFYGSMRFSEAASKTLARATKGNAWKVNQDNAQPGHFQDTPNTYSLNELSVRTVQAMSRYAKGFAWLNGDEKVTPGHLKTVMPYLLWHKVQPSEKALAEDPHYHNDRIAYVNGLIERVETDFNEFRSDATHREAYLPALMVLQTGRIGDRVLKPEEQRKIVRNAIVRLGAIDKPYALSLAGHLAAEYNAKVTRGSYDSD